jgi:hypothetical protein
VTEAKVASAVARINEWLSQAVGDHLPYELALRAAALARPAITARQSTRDAGRPPHTVQSGRHPLPARAGGRCDAQVRRRRLLDPEVVLRWIAIGVVVVVAGTLTAAVNLGIALDGGGQHVPGNPFTLMLQLAKGDR